MYNKVMQFIFVWRRCVKKKDYWYIEIIKESFQIYVFLRSNAISSRIWVAAAYLMVLGSFKIIKLKWQINA